MQTTAISASPAQTNQPASTLSVNGGEISEQFSQFLELLTTQVENQDPLTPLDSTQFVEQLATFSSLEQQVQSNVLLQRILDKLG